MKKKYINVLFLISSLVTLGATQEVELNPTTIVRNSSYDGSVTANETKNVILITKDEIQKKNHKDLISVFEDSPVTMVTHTQAGPLIGMRGSGEKSIMRVKVLLDGTSINTVDDSMGVIPFNAIPVSSVERIEIIPGGGITLYGSGTSSGVINIVTKSGKIEDYGVLNMTASSFDTYNINLSKGISLGEKVSLNLGVEAEKGKGYRDKEEHEKINLLGGINFKLNDKNRFRIYGNQYIENADSTDELDLISLQKNRRGAGPSDANIKVDRKSWGIDYEFKPTKDFTLTVNYNQSKFSRDIKQDNRPYLTFVSYAWFQDLFGVPEGHSVDLVMVDVNNKLTGNISEKIKNARIKTDYNYADGKGKLVFGYDYSDHKLHRDMNVQVDPYKPYESTALFVRKNEDRIINEEILKQNPKSLMRFDLATYFYLLDASTLDAIGLKGQEIVDYAMSRFYEYTDYEDEKRDYENGVAMPFGWNTLLNKPWAVIGDLGQLKLIDYTQNGNAYINDFSGTQIAITDDLMYKDLLRTINPDSYDPTLRMWTQTSSFVDVEKETNSFYLFNNYQLTDRLDMNLGLRYEKADYKGYRYTKATQFISGDAENSETKEQLGIYTSVSDVEYIKKQNTSSNWTGNDTYNIKLEELKANGITSVDMTELFRKDKRTEENLGGEIGFNYKLNNTDTAYIKYERGFNSPLPTQLTNKTFDPRTKIKGYWESNLKTEKIDNVEIGIRGMLSDNISYSFAGFISDTKNEILSIVKDGSSHMNREWRFINIDKTRRMGLEFQSEQVFDKLKLKESITYVDPKILSNDYEGQVRQIGRDRAEELYNSIKKTQLDFSIPFSLSSESISEAKKNRLIAEAKVIINNLMEGNIDQAETKVLMQALLDTTDLTNISTNTFRMFKYINICISIILQIEI